jgi:hypothetical protein
MSILGINFDAVNDPKLLPADVDLKLRVKAISVETSKTSGRQMIKVIAEDPSDPMSEDVIDRLMLPVETDDPKQANRYGLRVRNFLLACGATPKGALTTETLEQLVGCTFWCTLSRDDDPTYGASMRFKSFSNPV